MFRFMILIYVCAAFPLKCPEPAQWALRARSHCPDPSKYFCLKNDLINSYSENCTVSDFLQPGRKHVLRGGLDADICSTERYQPWPLNFYTNASFNCIFLKSACNEEGQVVNGNGSRNTDSTCRCDYTKGYDFLVKPRNPCFCVPLEEDCSCYLKLCIGSTLQLTPDYECIDTRMNKSMTHCRKMMNGRNNTNQNQNQTQYLSRTDNSSSAVLWKKIAGMSTFFFCIGLIFVFCGNELLEKYYRKANFILEPTDEITILEGHVLRLEYTLLINRFASEFKRNNCSIGKAEHIGKTETGRSKTLLIKPISLADAGEYCMDVEGIKSKPTKVFVKPLFKRPLKDITHVEGLDIIFECETEKENGDVVWFKDDVKMTYNTEKLETELGCIYTLKIKKSKVEDSGNYTIEKNGIRSKSYLDVKVLFKRPLTDVNVVEGSISIFECETEKLNGNVEWFKDDVKMTVNSEKLETEQGYIYKLTIKQTSVKDSGAYRIEINGIRSEAVLGVKAMFKRELKNITVMEGLDIHFECETEVENSYVAWFKDDILITMNTGHIKKETLTGNNHTLAISPARLQDSGNYRVENNGISSKAVLAVQEMPETIKQMSKPDREEFLKATKSGTTQRYYIRIMIVGESSAGKTCLLRRLMNKPIDDVTSTDGLDIERQTCQVDIKTGEWHFPKTDRDSYSVWSVQNEQFADCGFWDFAGQKEFYATHQTFLSANAVYLLAADISKDLSRKTYYDMLEGEFDSVGEYIDFWLDNVHCYRTDVHNELNQSSVDLNPPVIIVGTGIDKIALNDREDSQKNFQNHLRKVLSDHEKRRHLRKTHFLSNKCPSDNGIEFKKLREEIFKVAKNLKNWGDHLPSRWIYLEKVIYSKRSEVKYTMSYDEIKELAETCSFQDIKQTTSELDSFLKYEHDIGNIIFFEDVKDFIVLDPKWLVDVFKCFVSNQYADELINMPEWSELENKGKLANYLIVKLLEKVPNLSLVKHKQFVLQIMEKFDIIVKPTNAEASEILYMPCMIKSATRTDIIREIGADKCKKKTSWFILEFDFLPPSYFNHILVSLVKEKRLSTKKDNQLCIYRNIGLFDINESGTRVLMICLSQNAIAMQALQWNLESHCYSDIKNKVIDLVRSMKLRYRLNITHTNKFKCSTGNCFVKEGRVDFCTVLAEGEYRCTEHKDIHSGKDIIKSWLTEKEIEEEYKNNGRRKCNYCERMSVYKCYDCITVVCLDCFRKHKDQQHLLQLISDSFILNDKFTLSGKLSPLMEIAYLPGGLLVVVYNGDLNSYSVSGIHTHVKSFVEQTDKIAVVDKSTVAVILVNSYLKVAMVNLQQNNIQYLEYEDILMNFPSSIIYIENQLYVADNFGINIIDLSRTVKERIELSFIPRYMCYDVDLQRIYCVDRDSIKLICIDRDGTVQFTFADPNWTNLKSLTIDNSGNVLVICVKGDDDFMCVAKVDCDGKSSDVVISNLKMSYLFPNTCMCFHHLNNSVVIGRRNTVYIYEKEAKV